MKPTDLRKLPPDLMAELERRAERSSVVSKARRFLDDLHPKQRAFVCDTARRKVALCSRRAGKSHGILAWLLSGALDDPGGLSVYVARSKGDARRILHPAIDYYSKRYTELGLRLREVDGQLQLVVGITQHTIWLAGCSDQSDVGKFRGSKYKRVAIDESQEYGAWLRTLVTDSFEPALIDKAGHLLLAGTPSPIPAGLFYEVSTGDGGTQWPTHHWTIFDNPHIPDAASEVSKFCETYALNTDSATYQREYLGIWVRDESALVYPYSGNLNAVGEDEVPENMNYILGVDVGFTDATAFIVLGVRHNHPEVWVVEAWKRTGLIPSAVAAHVEAFREKYGHGLQIVVDEGGMGKGYAEEMRQRYGIGCVAAEKTKKRAFQEIVSGEFRSGTIKIVTRACGQLLDELCLLQWLPDRSESDPRFEDHLADALTYAVRAARTAYRPEIEGPTVGSAKWLTQEQARARELMKRRVAERTRKTGKRW